MKSAIRVFYIISIVALFVLMIVVNPVLQNMYDTYVKTYNPETGTGVVWGITFTYTQPEFANILDVARVGIISIFAMGILLDLVYLWAYSYINSNLGKTFLGLFSFLPGLFITSILIWSQNKKTLPSANSKNDFAKIVK